MDKRMPARESLEVYESEDGYVCVKQGDGSQSAPIALEPSQIPILVRWLQDSLVEVESSACEDDVCETGALNYLWWKYLGVRHSNTWLESLRKQALQENRDDSGHSTIAEHVAVVIRAEARAVIRSAVCRKREWDVAHSDEGVASVAEAFSEKDCVALGEVLAGITVWWLCSEVTLLSLPKEDAERAALAIMRFAAVMENELSLYDYRERLKLVSVLLNGRCGPYEAEIEDRMALLSIMSIALGGEGSGKCDDPTRAGSGVN